MKTSHTLGHDCFSHCGKHLYTLKLQINIQGFENEKKITLQAKKVSDQHNTGQKTVLINW